MNTENKRDEKIGRPTKYKKEHCQQAYHLCLLGATDAELADFFQISESTLNLWKQKHEEFSEALKKGKDIADFKVVDALYKKAIGAVVPEEKVFMHQGKPITVIANKYIPPDTTAAIFWLKNRQNKRWRNDKTIDFITHQVEEKESIEQLSDEELEESLKKINDMMGVITIPIEEYEGLKKAVEEKD